jgi:hypothetical protein
MSDRDFDGEARNAIEVFCRFFTNSQALTGKQHVVLVEQMTAEFAEDIALGFRTWAEMGQAA